MCVDFTDLNKPCPKDSYPLPNIDRLVDDTSSYQVLSFMDAYSGYNQIQMHPDDEDKTTFVTDKGATYQRLMDKIFKNQIGRNIEIYVDDMVINSSSEKQHEADLQEVFQQLRAYNMRLNPEKCAFGIQKGKFLGFLLTNRGIEANLDKCQAILNMQSPKTIKEVQRLTGCLATLSKFLPAAATRSYHFFKTMEKSDKFIWTEECEKAFSKFKHILGSPPILKKPEQGILLKDDNRVQAEQSIKFLFETTNNQAEYEALLAGLREQNGRADILSKLATYRVTDQTDKLHHITLTESSLDVKSVLSVSQEEDSRSTFIRYLKSGEIPEDENPRTFKYKANQYTLLGADLYKRDLHIKHHFSSVEHPQTNGLAEAANKVILQALKKKLTDAKGRWAELIPEILWSYNTTPHTTTNESPFRLVYGADCMIPIEISQGSTRTEYFDEQDNSEARSTKLDLINEERSLTGVRQQAMQATIRKQYNKKVRP
ncbi:uncharacterized protein [Arachis hypogaea]|uniref:uncharacterized protein n=1 Tax=Arachis hypogaea TaxID=3818 RepID=UPI003B21BC01